MKGGEVWSLEAITDFSTLRWLLRGTVGEDPNSSSEGICIVSVTVVYVCYVRVLATVDTCRVYMLSLI